MLDLMQPIAAGRQFVGFGWEVPTEREREVWHSVGDLLAERPTSLAALASEADATSAANRVSAAEAAAGSYSLTTRGFADANGINV